MHTVSSRLSRMASVLDASITPSTLRTSNRYGDLSGSPPTTLSVSSVVSGAPLSRYRGSLPKIAALSSSANSSWVVNQAVAESSGS